MSNDSDYALLRCYVETHSEDALRLVIERYANLVYSACFRRLRQHQDAEDAGQAVFIILAQKAASFSPATVLPDWLFQTSQYVVANMQRSKRSRTTYERLAGQQREKMAQKEEDTQWERLKPLLDRGLTQLSSANRQALVLRYLVGKSHAEVGQELQCSEAAARKRIYYALEQLRKILAREQAAFSVVLLTGLLERAAQPYETAMLKSFSASATNAAVNPSASSKSALLAKATARTMLQTKLQLAGIAAALIIGISALAWVSVAKLRPSSSPAELAMRAQTPSPAADSKPLVITQTAAALSAEQAEQIEATIFKLLPQAEFRTAISGPFLLVTNANEAGCDELKQKTLERSYQAISRRLFADAPPVAPFLVFALKDQNTYIHTMEQMVKRKPKRPYGDIVPERRALFVNLETETINGGMVYITTSIDTPHAPHWLHWGLARLYEQMSIGTDGKAVGSTEWHAPYVYDDILQGRAITLKQMLELPDREFIARFFDSSYPRYFVQWLQDQGKLERLYAAFRSTEKPDAVALVRECFNGASLETIEDDFNTWMEQQATLPAIVAQTPPELAARLTKKTGSLLAPLPEIDRFQLARMEKEARRTLPPGFDVYIRNSDIFVSELPAAQTNQWIDKVFGVVTEKLIRQFRMRRNEFSPMISYLFKNPDSYKRWSRQIFDEDARSLELGFSMPERNAFVVNTAIGDSAILYLAGRTLFNFDYPKAPSWFEIGYSLLFAMCRLNQYGDLEPVRVGLSDLLAEAYQTKRLILPKDLLASDTDFYQVPVISPEQAASARFLLQWLSEKGLATQFYTRVRDWSDPTPGDSLRAVFKNQFTLDELGQQWLTWVGEVVKSMPAKEQHK